MVYIICFLIAVAAAFVGSLIGLGGGVVLIPSLIFMFQFSDEFAWALPQMIVGISLVTMVFTAFSSTISYVKKGRVDYKTGLLFLTGSIPGGILGSWLNQYLNTENFSLYFGILIIVISLLFFIKRKPRDKQLSATDYRTFEVDGETYHYKVTFLPAFIISLIVGTMSGLFGLGGGSIMVPAMILMFGLPVHIATATSMFMILFISIISASTHIALGHVPWEYALLFIPGAWIGGKLGAKTNQNTSGNILEWVLRIILIIVGIRLIF
ncbi:sulfite exporter TauE/SafE family protein [Virgibacillus doumboii]|uniref:sulfite exporter TauE/SafE family protein n=1 Tax=Virgibacillus doumboii TaxID=2697503 RepID=UPI0013E0A951|nr:sulfite exporter TauE/SafE family protein [Virgibacillus doumboii]